MNKLKTIAITIILLISSLTFFISCFDNEPSKNQNNSQITPDLQESTENPRLAIPDNLPERDFDGYVFKVLAHEKNKIKVEEESGEVIEDAIYKRNQIVEDRFNVRIEQITIDDENDLIKQYANSVLANSDDYDLVLCHMVIMSQSATQNLYLDWFQIPYIDLTKPWWIQSATEELSIFDKTFFAVGDLTSTSIDATYCMYFNKKLMVDYGIEFPYRVVRDGEWTFDYMVSQIKDIYSDLNSNDIRDIDDFYGMVTNIHSANNVWNWAFDNPIIKKDSDGIPQLVINNEKTFSIVDKLYDFYFNNQAVYQESTNPNYAWWDLPPAVFKNSRTIFTTGMFSYSTLFREMEDDYGIIPYPKWDEKQASYYTMLDGYAPLFGVPITASNIERTGIIVEAMSAEGYKYITPAYYDIALKIKFSRDEDSAEMIDTVLAGRRFDFGYLYDGWNGMAFFLENMFYHNNKDFASYYSTRESAALKNYEEIIKAYENYNN